MRNHYSIEERNRIVEEHLHCVDSVMRRNYALIRAARLEWDDTYQDLCVRLIRAVINYDPEKGDLEWHTRHQLRYELLSCTRPYRMTGITGAPRDFRKGAVVSLDAFDSATHTIPERKAA